MNDHKVQKLNGQAAGNAGGIALVGDQHVESDYRRPRVLDDHDEYVWNDNDLPHKNYIGLGQRLAQADDLYRRPNYASGLLLGSPEPNVDPEKVTTGKRLAAIITDRVPVRVMKNGNTSGNFIPSHHLSTMLNSEPFLQNFRPVDAVRREPCYLPDFSLTMPGYNNGGPGYRYLYTGSLPQVLHSLDAISKFLDVMQFDSNADRTNAVAAALTVLFRNFWPGGKPLIAVTSTKSHGGKDTIIDFACGGTEKVSVSYEKADWPLQKSIVMELKHCPEAGVVNVGNVRQDGRNQFIASAFLERFITDPEPVLYSPGTGDPQKIKNQLVVTLSTNFGTLSEDLLNRALPIHLAPVGDVASRKSPIGNPRFEYLPAHREAIAAELRGMIDKWLKAGKPLDTKVAHPFSAWASTIGGILMVNGVKDFLGNYAQRRTVDDPVRKGLGVLGAFAPNTWWTADKWARVTRDLGLVKTLIPEMDRDTDASRARGIGVILTNHRDENFEAETDDQKLTLKLEKARRRFDQGKDATTRYRFVVTKRENLPEDGDKNTTDSTSTSSSNRIVK